MRRFRIIALPLLVAGTVLLALSDRGLIRDAPMICQKFGTAAVQGNRYIVQNNVWGAGTAQCIKVDGKGGFAVDKAGHHRPVNGPPAAYPAIYAGCHYARCSKGSMLPMLASSSEFKRVHTSVSMSYPDRGTWNAAYDLWFDPTPRTDGQNTGAEVMIWLNRRGSIRPVGAHVGTANLLGATWDVWFGKLGWNVISYVRTSSVSSLEFAVDTFYSDAINRGHAKRDWYLTSVQAGFETWVGGTGLGVNSFSYGVEDRGGHSSQPNKQPGRQSLFSDHPGPETGVGSGLAATRTASMKVR